MTTQSSTPTTNPTPRGGPGLMGNTPMRGMRPGGGPMAMMRRGEKPRDFKGTLRKLIQYLGRYQGLIIFIMVAGDRLDSREHRRTQNPG